MPIATLAPQLWFFETYDDGKPIVGGLVASFLAGTVDTPTPTFADKDLLVPNSNPIVLDASGRAIARLDPSKAYKFVVMTPQGVVLRTVDHVGPVAPFTSDLDIQGVAGENLAANDCVYLSGGDGGTIPGRWYKTNATVVAKSTGANLIAMVPYGMLNAQTGSIRIQGRLTDFSGLTPGAPHYVSTIPGAITAIAPANRKFVGVAESSTTLVFTPTQSFLQGDIACATLTTSGNVTVGGTLGVTGGTTLSQLTVTGPATITGPVAVTGGLTAGLLSTPQLMVTGSGPHRLGSQTEHVSRGVTATLSAGGSASFVDLVRLAGILESINSGTECAALRIGEPSGGELGFTATANMLSAAGLMIRGSAFAKNGTGVVTTAASLYVQDAPTFGTKNYALWVADGTTFLGGPLHERGRQAAMGEWIPVPYLAADFTASSGQWLVEFGDVRQFAYMLVGQTMTVAFSIVSTTCIGAGNELRIKIPGGFTAAAGGYMGALHVAGTENGPALGFSVTRDIGQAGGAGLIACFKANLTAWTDSADGTTLNGSITFKVQ